MLFPTLTCGWANECRRERKSLDSLSAFWDSLHGAAVVVGAVGVVAAAVAAVVVE